MTQYWLGGVRILNVVTILSGDGWTKGVAEYPSIIRGKAWGYLREYNRMTLIVLVDWLTELYCVLVL